MAIRINFISILSLMFFCTTLSAQFDLGYIRDSIEIEKGVSGTLQFEPFFKIINEASDDNNRPLISVIYQYDSPTTTVPFQRQVFEYESDFMTSFTLESWDEVQEEWVPVRQELRNYNNDLLTTFLRKKEIDGVLVNNRRWAYIYNGNGHETERLLQGWNTDTNSWENLSRKTTTYNNEDRILTQLLERYNSGNWQNSRRRAWNWMPGDLQPNQTLAQKWSEANQEWINLTRKTYSMGIDGLWSGSIIEEWDSDNSEWVNDIKSTITADFTNNSSVILGELWDNSWVPNLKSTYAFSNDMNTALLEQWNENTMEFDNNLRYRSEFNDNIPIKKIGMQKWNLNSGNWENRDYTRRITYFWSENQNTPTEEINTLNKCIIPNPYLAGSNISCDFPIESNELFLEVINLYGQVTLRKKVTGQQLQINDQLIPGLYIVKIYTPDQIYHLEKIIFGQ